MVELHSKEAVEFVKKWLHEKEYDTTSVHNADKDCLFVIKKEIIVINIAFYKRSKIV
jgi:hypothetical protein